VDRVLTPVADGVFVHRSELLRNLTVVVHGRAGALVVDPGITAAELACLGDDRFVEVLAVGWWKEERGASEPATTMAARRLGRAGR
jgi:glyoxylase-like metal-dependent hydrolase (beta-lactamase superfamily II)